MERDEAALEFKQRFFVLDIAWRDLDLRADFVGKTSASRKKNYSRSEADITVLTVRSKK